MGSNSSLSLALSSLSLTPTTTPVAAASSSGILHQVSSVITPATMAEVSTTNVLGVSTSQVINAASTTSPAAAASNSAAAVTSAIVASVSSAIINSPTTTPAAAATSSAAAAATSAAVVPASTAALVSTAIIASAGRTTQIVVTGSTLPASTVLVTSVVTASRDDSGTSLGPITVVVTKTSEPSVTYNEVSTTTATTSSASTSSSGAASLPGNSEASSSNGGLSPAGTIAVAVVVPIVVVALLVLLGLFLWRKRKQSKNAQEARRKEVEEYGYNPNDDPTLPAVAGLGSSDAPQMAEDTGGYRGWGANSASNRKTSTTISGLSSGAAGLALSDDGRQRAPGSPGQATASDGSENPLVDGAIGSAAIGAAGERYNSMGNSDGIHRGPSNASSSYSNAGHTEEDEAFTGHQQEYGYDQNYSQYTPYHPGTGGYGEAGQPVVRDVNARRNTKIENPSVWPQQGNSGIAQNF